MIRNTLLAFLFVNMFFFCSSKHDQVGDCPYSKLLTNDLGTSSNFIPAEIKGSDSIFTIVISSRDFYRIYFMNRKITKEDYVQDVINHWRKGEPFQVDSIEQKTLFDYSIKKDEAFNKLFGLNKEQILATYFDNNILKNAEMDFEQEKKLIYSLVKQGVPCWTHHQSGYILVKDTIISTNCE